MAHSFAVVGADTLAAKRAVRAAGCTHVVVQAYWDRLQPAGPGSALDAGQLAALVAQYDDAAAVGLRVVLEHAVHFPPAWVADRVEAFRDQSGREYLPGPDQPGKRIRNWMWTAAGRALVADLVALVAAGIGQARVAATDRVRFGGGWYGELQYPAEYVSAPYSYYGFGTAMQTGRGLAEDPLLRACPLPGYRPFTGTDAQDAAWIDWYLDGIESWLLFGVARLKAAGYRCDLMVLHPGSSVRADQTRADAAYRQNTASGVDFVRALGRYKDDPQVWPWSTWINGPDPASPVRVDSDQAAWKKLAAEATLRGKGARMWGENTGGEDDAGMDEVFAEALAPVPASGLPLQVGTSSRPASYTGYAGLMWLDYRDLTSGTPGRATLAHYRAAIARDNARAGRATGAGTER